MQFAVAPKSIEKHGTFEEMTFSIKDTAFILDLLRSKIYSNPISTVTQEIACNARDAHREMGKDDIPVHIKLPNALDPRWVCRDFGPGITPCRMADVFVRYGTSTKRDTNEQTGGFGIGAKTPWAYTDSFGIETYCPEDEFTDSDGIVHNNVMVKRVYIAYIDESRIGKLALTNAPGTITEEKQGTAISLTVKSQDFRAFKDCTRNATTYWDTRPEVTGDADFDYPTVEIKMQGEGWCLLEPDSNVVGFNSPIALVDGIPYTLRNTAIFKGDSYYGTVDADGAKIPIHKVWALPIRLYFNTGEVMLTANREEIDYKGSNIEEIAKRIKDCLTSIRKTLLQDVADAPNLWQAYNRWYAVRMLHGDMVNEAKWKTRKISQNSFQIERTGAVILEYRNGGDSVYPKFRSKTHNYLSPTDKGILVLNDEVENKIKRGKIWTLMKANPGFTVAVVNVIDTANRTAVLDKMNKDFGFNEMEPLLLSKIAVTPVPSMPVATSPSGTTAAAVARRKRYTRTYEVISPNGTRTEEDCNLVDDAFTYVWSIRDNWSLNATDDRWSTFYDSELKTIAAKLGIKIFLIPTKDADKVGKSWINLKSALEDKAKALESNLKVTQVVDENFSMANAFCNLYSFVTNNLTEIEKELKADGALLKYFNQSKNSKANDKDYAFYQILCRVLRKSESIQSANITKVKFNAFKVEFEKMYPLLTGEYYKINNNSYSFDLSPEHFVDYCKLCEK